MSGQSPKGWRRRGRVMNELRRLCALSLEMGGKDARVGECGEISVRCEKWTLARERQKHDWRWRPGRTLSPAG